MRVCDVIRGDEVVAIIDDETVSQALEIMAREGVRHLAVVREAHVVGVLSERDALARAWLESEDVVVREAMSPSVITAAPSLEVEHAAALLLFEGIEALPVVQDGALVGVLTPAHLVPYVTGGGSSLRSAGETPTVATLMVRRVETIFADDLLTEAAARMVMRGVRHLPVVDGTMCVRGILSERDLRQATGARPLDLASDVSARLRVADAMTPDPRTIGEDEPLGHAVRAFVDDRFGALPVVDEEERLLGILSYIDLLRYLGRRLT